MKAGFQLKSLTSLGHLAHLELTSCYVAPRLAPEYAQDSTHHRQQSKASSTDVPCADRRDVLVPVDSQVALSCARTHEYPPSRKVRSLSGYHACDPRTQHQSDLNKLTMMSVDLVRERIARVSAPKQSILSNPHGLRQGQQEPQGHVERHCSCIRTYVRYKHASVRYQDMCSDPKVRKGPLRSGQVVEAALQDVERCAGSPGNTWWRGFRN